MSLTYPTRLDVEDEIERAVDAEVYKYRKCIEEMVAAAAAKSDRFKQALVTVIANNGIDHEVDL